MKGSDQFDKIDSLLNEIKQKSFVVEVIVEEKLQQVQANEIDEDEYELYSENEIWETFLVHYSNYLSSFRALNYYLPKRYPEPGFSNLDVNVDTVNFKFLVSKYDMLLNLMRQFAGEVNQLSKDLVDHHPFQTWKQLVVEKVDEFGENAAFFHEHI